MPTVSSAPVAVMTPRQRWLALLSGRTPDRIVTDYRATPEFHQRLKRDLGIADDEALWRRLHIDAPYHVWPHCLLEHHPDDPQANLWGIRKQKIDYGSGSYDEVAHHPLAHITCADELKKFHWPTPDDFDYSNVTTQIRQSDGQRIIHGGFYEPFLLYCSLRGLEQGFEDLLLNPDIADGILGRLFDFHYEVNRRIFTAGGGKIELTKIAEDLGGQTGPLMSVELYQRFLLPNQKKMADLARSFGVHIGYHTDGAARVFLPYLIDEVGIEALDPIQWRCPGMEREGLVRDFGDRIIFHGAMDNQQTLPFGTVDDVIAEVKENLSLFRVARWICAPCHNIQAVSPTANILAMYEAIYENGKL